MGLGHFGGGVGAVRFLVERQAKVTVTDLKDEDALADSLAALEGLDVAYRLGGHREADFTDADMLVVSPAVPKSTSQWVQLARRHKIPITSEMNLFLRLCPATICAVTGSVGKSTTTAMIHHAMSRSQQFRDCYLGGNIGRSLLPEVDRIGPADLAVLELSSFMLDDADPLGFRPDVALVTNIVPNHLDRYGTMANYVRAKKRIARHQTPDDVLILNRSLKRNTRWKDVGQARRAFFDIEDERSIPHGLWRLSVPGRHNVENALGAWEACKALGVDPEEAVSHLQSYRGLPDRLELVGMIGGVNYVNDSKSTSPAAAITGLNAFPEGRILLIAGGSPKNVSYAEMARAIRERARVCIVIGQTGPEIAGAIMEEAGDDGTVTVLHAESLERAVALASEEARKGDVVLLSPGCASYDMFANYEERGHRFRTLVRALE